MIRFLRDLRLLPIAVVACACLFALIVADFLLDDNSLVGGNTVRGRRQRCYSHHARCAVAVDAVVGVTDVQLSRRQRRGADTRRCIAAGGQNKSGYHRIDPERRRRARRSPRSRKSADAKPNAKPDTKPPDTKPAGTFMSINGQAPPSGAERAILERLQERRQELDTRARELDIRESLMQAAEKRMAGQLAEIKETEQRITVATQQKDDAQAARFKGLVTMYENMKPRDAAKIFDRLEIGVLIEVASKIEPRKMADIMAQMSPDTAQRLTVELASRAQDSNPGGNSPAAGLPKIQSQPTTQ